MSDLTRDGAKFPGETVAVRWRYASGRGGGGIYGAETLTGGTIVITLTCVSGPAVPAVTVVGAAAIDGSDVVALLTAGAAGSLWRRHCKVNTSAGQVLERARLLPIEDA